MDDLQEKEAKDINNIGQFIYVSAWTSDEKESIPMWNMYSSLDAGVRIRLRTNPFFTLRMRIQFKNYGECQPLSPEKAKSKKSC